MEPAPIGMDAHPAGTMDFGEPLDVDFGNGFTLIGCKSGADRLRPGETAKVRLFIRCKEKQVGAVRCFGQLLLPSRNVINGGIFSMHRLSGVTQSVFFQKDEVLYSDVECQIPLGQVPSPLDIFAFLGVFAAERDTKSRESERNTVGKRIKISRIYVE